MNKKLIKTLQETEKFLIGFEDDEMNPGVDKLLRKIRKQITRARKEDEREDIQKFMDFVAPMTFVNMLGGMETYRDQVLKEHIYNIEDVHEKVKEWKVSFTKKEKEILEKISKDLHKNECGYFRIIFS